MATILQWFTMQVSMMVQNTVNGDWHVYWRTWVQLWPEVGRVLSFRRWRCSLGPALPGMTPTDPPSGRGSAPWPGRWRCGWRLRVGASGVTGGTWRQWRVHLGPMSRLWMLVSGHQLVFTWRMSSFLMSLVDTELELSMWCLLKYFKIN